MIFLIKKNIKIYIKGDKLNKKNNKEPSEKKRIKIQFVLYKSFSCRFGWNLLTCSIYKAKKLKKI